MWEICSREKPWNFVSHSWQIAEKVGKGERLPLAEDNPLKELVQKCWVDNPDARPTFSEIYEELEKIKNGIPIESRPATQPTISSPPSTRVSMTADMSPEARILDAFGAKTQITWDEFAQALTIIYPNTQKSTIQSLKHTLGPEGLVEKSSLVKFLRMV